MMKKRLLPFILLTLVTGLSFAGTYTLKVTVNDSASVCYVAGSFNNWDPAANPMTMVSDAPKVFTLDIEVADEDVASTTYKYLAGPAWKYEQKESADFNLSELTPEGDTVTSFKAYYDIGQEADVTISVLVPADLVVCYLTGSFNSWNSTSDEMTLVDSTANGKEFTLTIHTQDTTTLEYKFLAGPGWPYEQTNSTNYVYMTDGGVVVCDEFKAIFDPTKVGDITINITVPEGTNEVWVVGSYNGWDIDNAVQATMVDETHYTAVIPQVADIEYKIWNHNEWAYEEAADDQGTSLASNRVASFETGPVFDITVEFWKELWGGTGPSDDSFVKTSASAYPEGSTIMVTYLDPGSTATDWLGIYMAGEVPDGDPASLDWAYVDGDSGTIEFTTELTPGDYTVFLLCCDGYDVIAQYDFKIVDASGAYLVASSLTYLETDTLVFDYVSPSWSDTDWIGVYNPGDVPGGGPYSIIWKYIPAAAGTISWVYEEEHTLAPGEYWAGLFCCDGYDMYAETWFVIEAAPTAVMDLTASEMILYPNPTSGMVNIRSANDGGIREIKVYNLTGTLVYMEQFPGVITERSLDLGNLARGIYLVKTSTEKGVRMNRLVIQ